MVGVARIWEWRYTLTAVADGRTRDGSLIRVEFDDGTVGHADLHLWPELGNSRAPILARSIALARADAKARAEGVWLLEGLTIPPSHASLPYGFTMADLDRAREAGYRHVKVKAPVADFETLRSCGLHVRVDFNGIAPDPSVIDKLEGMDWVEDPGPYDSESWTALRSLTRVAADFVSAPPGSYDVRIVKPAREETPADSIPLAFTTYLGHPLGSVAAAWAAGQAIADGRLLEAGGLTSHTAYETDAFSERLAVQQGVLQCPPGPGIGFDDLLDALPWRPTE